MKNLKILLLALFAFSLCSCKKKTVKMVTEEKDYLLIKEQNETIEIPIYIEDEFSFYLSKEKIVSAQIFDQTNDEKYLLSLNKTTKTANYLEYENLKLSEYILDFSFDFESSEMIKLPNAFLELNYQNDLTHTLEIGSFCYTKDSIVENLSLKKAKGIINSFDQTLTTVGVILEIENSTNKKQTISKFSLISGFSEIDASNIMILDSYDIDSSTDVFTICQNYDFLYQEKETTFLYEINSGESVILFLPISYFKSGILDKIGLRIEFLDATQIIDPFPSFATSLNESHYFLYVAN